ncbi:MAG: efflux RND transporter periplasmic adaptor subunit [Pseudomonadota bacterium]
MRYKRSIYWQLVGILSMLAFLLVAGCKNENKKSNQLPLLPVKVAHPLQKEITEWDEFTGRFEAIDEVDIRARVSGYLDKILFKDGQLVKKGDLLFVIDQRPFKNSLELAQGELQQAIAEREYSKLQLDRFTQLRKEKAVSEQQLDEGKLRYNNAVARVKISQARLDQAKLDLEFTEIRAPVSGRIGRELVSQGNLIIGGDNNTTLLAKIVTMDPIYLVFELDENSFLKYERLFQEGKRPMGRKESNPIAIKLLDEKTFSHKGQMNFVDNQFDLNTGTILARATVPNPNFLIHPGQFARLRLPGSGKYEALLLPDKVILTDQTKQFVYIVDAKNQVSKKNITLGPLIDNLRIIRSGLTLNDEVVINHLQKLRPGMKVKAVKTKLEAEK